MKPNHEADTQSSQETPTKKADTTRHETLEEFSKRLGIKHIKEQGGVEISPYSGGNLSRKKPKKASGS